MPRRPSFRSLNAGIRLTTLVGVRDLPPQAAQQMSDVDRIPRGHSILYGLSVPYGVISRLYWRACRAAYRVPLLDCRDGSPRLVRGKRFHRPAGGSPGCWESNRVGGLFSRARRRSAAAPERSSGVIPRFANHRLRVPRRSPSQGISARPIIPCPPRRPGLPLPDFNIDRGWADSL